MLLPGRESAYIPPEKLAGYLLSETHALGREKARFFRAHGYNDDNIRKLEQGLLAIAREGAVLKEVVSIHGTKYVVEGTLATPRGTTVSVRTIWIVEQAEKRPRFVTAYPAKEVTR
jgi:hypothetical protein